MTGKTGNPLEIALLKAGLLEYLMRVIAALEAFKVTRRKFTCQPKGNSVWQQVVDNGMWKR